MKQKRDPFGRFLPSTNPNARKRKKKTPKLTAQQVASGGSSVNKPPTPVNHVGLVLDCSGSMESVWSDVIRELKANINTVRGESIKLGQTTDLTLTTFGDLVNTVFQNKSISEAQLPDYLQPNLGMTALYDATADCISKLQQNRDINDANTSCLLLVFTDGDENASKRWRADELKVLIQNLQKTDRWSFCFVVPPGAKGEITQRLGLPDGNVIEWEQTSAGVKAVTNSITRGVSSYYAGRSVGVSATKGFFTADLNNVSVRDVQNKLDDIAGEVRILNVPKEVKIKDFVEAELGRYVIGSAFYQLSKDEKLSHKKQILVMERGKKAVYGGAQARKLLNIPAGQDIKVRPGNLGALDLFVQSESVNRLLVRGTKLIVRV